jgi:predicted small metal-binding protein
MKRFRCGDVIPGCAAAFAGTEDEILSAAARHARDVHDVDEMSDELVATVRAAMVTLAA